MSYSYQLTYNHLHSFENKMGLSSTMRKSSTLQIIIILAIAAATIWLSHFSHSANFGLYEDDYTRIPWAMEMTGSELFEQIQSVFMEFKGHALPLQVSSILSFSFIGARVGDLEGIYFIGYLFLTLNACLFYALIARIWQPKIAVLATLSFGLYSADITQAYLTHSLGLQPSLTLLLLAFHSYLSGRKILAYLFVTGILFNYETVFLLFLGAPLLKKNWEKGLVKEILVNTAIVGAILTFDVLLRITLGENRVVNLQFPDVVVVPLTHMIQGPIVSLGTYIYRPIQTIQNLDSEVLLTIAASFIVLSLLISRLEFENTAFLRSISSNLNNVNLSSIYDALRDKAARFEASPEMRSLLRYASTGIVMLVLAYPLTFTVRAYAISGRETRVHFAGIIGASIIWSSLLYFIGRVSNEFGKKRFGILAIAGMLSLLIGFGSLVQRDYVASWQHQKSFWQQIVDLVPDLEKGTVILVEPDNLPETRYIGSNTWNLPRILELVFEFPHDWALLDIPRVYRLTPDWEDDIMGEEGLLHLNARTTVAPRAYDRAVDPSKVIILKQVDNQLTRMSGPLRLGGFMVNIKPEPDIQSTYPKNMLYDYLID